jgi:hypothetical protein
VLSFYSILINVCKHGIDLRESASDCILASSEGLSSGGETSHPMSLQKVVSSSGERTVLHGVQWVHAWEFVYDLSAVGTNYQLH